MFRTLTPLARFAPVCLALACFTLPNSYAAEKKAAKPSTQTSSELGSETPSHDLDSTPAAETKPAAPRAVVRDERTEERSAEQSASEYDGYGKTHGLLGPVTLGPSLTLLGLTRPFAGGLEGKFLDIAGAAFFYGFLPTIKISDVSIKYSSWDIRARWYVFQGAFFVGGAYGKQSLKASKTQVISGSTVNAALDMDTSYFSPHIGWHWVWDSGFFMGMDLGVQLPVSRKNTLTTNVPAALTTNTEYLDLVKKVDDNANKIGKVPLPLITFLKVGFLF